MDDAFTEKLPIGYRASRDIQEVKKTWNPVLYQEMSKHWDMIKEGMDRFSLAHTQMLKALSRYERDETAELVLREFLDDKFPGALELLTQIGPFIKQYPSYIADTTVITIDDSDANSDARSVTMGPEPGPSSRPDLTTSMGPPPRPVGLLTPITPKRHRDVEGLGDPGPSSIYDVPDSPPPDEAHGPLTLQQCAKRSLETFGVESPISPGSPSKKAKKTNGTQSGSPVKVTKTIDMWEVEGVEYIFKDKRCGPGWYVIRCNLGQQPGINPPGAFVKPPLENNIALDHFNSSNHSCHDTTKLYAIQDIIKEFAHRVTGHGLTEERIRSANEKLNKDIEQNLTKGSASKKRKGKERATETGNHFVATNHRAGTSDTDGSYKDEVRARTPRMEDDIGPFELIHGFYSQQS